MNCDYCGDAIFTGDEYYHDKENDKNYHCGECNNLNDSYDEPNEKRYREE